MRRVITPANLISTGIVAIVVAIVAHANWRDEKQSRGRETAALQLGASGTSTTSRVDLESRVTAMERRLATNPDDVRAAVQLADALLRLTRVTGTAGLAVRAEGVLKKALVEDPGNYEANRALGALYLSRHRFRDAIAAGQKARDLRPHDPLNYGVIGDGYLELGDYEQAFAAFDRMMQLRPSAGAYARVAYSRELQGDISGAIAAMKLAADATGADDPEGLAWTHSQIGELYFQLGRLYDAKVEFSAASRAFPGHPFAVSGYAKTIASGGDVAGALTLLENLARTSLTPDLAARIGDLLERLGRHEEAQKQYALAKAGWRGDMREPKSLAQFLADHGEGEEAVRVAETAAAERQDIFTEDALAWAYFKSGRLDEANEAMALALRTGTRDRDIRSHAAAIAATAPRMAAR
jgi:tetratricopeptide (TPR) repeat protein